MKIYHNSDLSDEFDRSKQLYTDNNANSYSYFDKLQKLMSALTQRLNKKMNKKISFHLGSEQPSIEFTTNKVAVKKKRKWTANRKKINRRKYKVKVKKKKQDKIRALVDKIKGQQCCG